MTIYDALAARLGRKPSALEVRAEVARIINSAFVEAAEKGRLAHTRFDGARMSDLQSLVLRRRVTDVP